MKTIFWPALVVFLLLGATACSGATNSSLPVRPLGFVKANEQMPAAVPALSGVSLKRASENGRTGEIPVRSFVVVAVSNGGEVARLRLMFEIFSESEIVVLVDSASKVLGRFGPDDGRSQTILVNDYEVARFGPLVVKEDGRSFVEVKEIGVFALWYEALKY